MKVEEVGIPEEGRKATEWNEVKFDDSVFGLFRREGRVEMLTWREETEDGPTACRINYLLYAGLG